MSPDPRFSRYAIYLIPDPQQPLFQRASKWLGWDCVKGRPLSHPAIGELANPSGLDIAIVTAAPRKYGFHGTIKPPMKLADGSDRGMLEQRAARVMASQVPFRVPKLKLSRIGKFLAVVPADPSAELQNLAADCVTKLDDLRQPLNDVDLARRRRNGLTDRQEALLQEYGYPYVLDEFRFHLTLSGPLDEAVAGDTEDMLREWLTPALASPLVVNRLALAGEDAETGQFSVISWLSFSADPTAP